MFETQELKEKNVGGLFWMSNSDKLRILLHLPLSSTVEPSGPGFLPNRGSNAYIGGTLKRTIKSWAYSPWNILSLWFSCLLFITFFYILSAQLHVLCSHASIRHRHAKMQTWFVYIFFFFPVMRPGTLLYLREKNKEERGNILTYCICSERKETAFAFLKVACD